MFSIAVLAAFFLDSAFDSAYGAVSNADLVASAAAKAEEQLSKRYDFYWAVASSVGTVLLIIISFLGLGAWRNVRQGLRDELRNELRSELLASGALKDEIRHAVSKDVAADFERNSSRLERQIKLNRLQYLANKLRTQDGFSNSERDALHHLLISLKDDPAIVADTDFKSSLEYVLDMFYSASIWNKFDEIEENLSHVIRDTMGIVETMVIAYGMRTIGEIDLESNTVAKFNKYIDIMESHKYPEMALPWRMAAEYSQPCADHDRQISRMIDECGDYTEQEVATLKRIVLQYSAIENFARNPKSYHRRLAQKFLLVRSTLEDHHIIQANE